MECFKIENLSFTYPGKSSKTLDCINLSVSRGEFVTICGKSGCGKTTLLRLLKSSLAPFGKTEGSISLCGKPLAEYDAKEEAAKTGFVMQCPESQIVTDKVWHELAFGLESLGYKTSEIRTRVSEMASFFGIQTWFHKNVAELSGGQKQLLNLASVMVMQPSVLILDEPTSQLDPIAAQDFIKILEKINRDLGVAVILTEHRLEEAFPVSDRIVVMDSGRIIADAEPRKVGQLLKNHDMYLALPSPLRIYGAVEDDADYPLTVREGRMWLEKFSKGHSINKSAFLSQENHSVIGETAVEIRNAYFRYEKNLPDVVKGLNLKVKKGELFTLLGGNGVGKTTALSLIAGLNRPYRGDVLINGRDISKKTGHPLSAIALLPQNPQTLFVKKTVYLDLEEMLSEKKLSSEEKAERIHHIASLCRINRLLSSHPYDLSGGEQQRAALAKVLLSEPEILLLDEPTKGMDAHFKDHFADILSDLKASGVTLIMVSHDIEFCTSYSDSCALVFDGSITSVGAPREFFSGNSFYTTSANRMARSVLPDAVLADDVIKACGGKALNQFRPPRPQTEKNPVNPVSVSPKKRDKLSFGRIIGGILFTISFFLTTLLMFFDLKPGFVSGAAGMAGMQILSIIEAGAALLCFLPKRCTEIDVVCISKTDRRLSKRTLCAFLITFIAIPVTIYTGVRFMGDRKYYLISLLIIIETIIPFLLVFESRKPKARELVIISVICALSVAGRAAFFMVPQFKPVVALVIIAGICLGGETGFLIGVVSGFVSNFFFGQGPWTPWQMFSFGIIGFLAGVLFKKGLLRRERLSLCVFGFVVTFVIYGGIMNPASIIMMQNKITSEMIISSYVVGIPFDIVHALSTAFFLWFIAEPMIEKLERVKVKYGLIKV